MLTNLTFWGEKKPLQNTTKLLIMKRWTNREKKKGGAGGRQFHRHTAHRKQQSLICLGLSYPACWFKPILTLTNTLTYGTTPHAKINFDLGRRARFEMGGQTMKKTEGTKRHNTILAYFQRATEYCSQSLRAAVWGSKEWAKPLCFHNSCTCLFHQHLRGPSLLNPARYTFAEMHLDTLKAK